MSEITEDPPPAAEEHSQNSVSESKDHDDGGTRRSKWPNKTAPMKIDKDCWFYLNGRCNFGKNCRYRHPRFRYNRPNHVSSNHSARSHTERWNNRNTNNDNHHDDAPSECNTNNESQTVVTSGEKADLPKPRRYRVFTNRNRYLNQDSVQPSVQKSDVNGFRSERVNHRSRAVINPRQRIVLSSLGKECLLSFRETEISQLRKRYPSLQAEQNNGNDVFSLSFASSDPDWAFDLRSVVLHISLPQEYPKDVCHIQIAEDSRMPNMLLKFLNNNVTKWVSERHAAFAATDEVELVLRPFFRWFDKNLEHLFIEGLRKVKQDVEAKKAGIEFVPYEVLLGASASSTVDERSVEEQKENVAHLNHKPVGVESLQDQESSGAQSSDNSDNQESSDALEATKSDASSSATKNHSTGKKGTEIKLLHFELREGAASLRCEKLAVAVRCARCKTFNEFASLPKQKHHSTVCPRCKQIQTADFQPMLLHAFSSILGYVHLVGCQAIDLPLAQCSFAIDCLNCSRENITDGIHYGQVHSTWCFFCNQKLGVSAHSAKFHLLQPIENTRTTRPPDGCRRARDPLIEVGKPLPNNGTCRHYKRSYRWLRFPCCGKAYPCDSCHNENETDHEMKYASRMICGLCSKEQPYSKERPCISCSSFLIKKSGTHWEGGKGCRDKIKMSREDKQKYTGANKTVSRKAVSVSKKI